MPKSPAAPRAKTRTHSTTRPGPGNKPGKRPAPRARLEVDARRAQLLSLGLEFFSSRAYDAVSIDDVARAAGISKGLLYHYFPTKKEFYVAALREAAGELLARTFVDAHHAPAERLIAGLDAFLGYVGQRGAAYAALLRGGVGSDPDVARVVDQTRQRFLARLMEGLPVVDPPPALRTALRGWIGFVEAASLEWVERRDVPPEKLRDLLADLLLHLLAHLATPTVG